ncbi:MAG TPA: hypothetical protein VGB67_04505, partial [Fibrella sp.]
MSKKKKPVGTSPAGPGTTRPSITGPTARPLSVPPVDPTSAEHVTARSTTPPVIEPPLSVPADSSVLIRFDRKAKWYVGFWVALFLVFTLLKIHTISIPVWNERLPDGSPLRKGLLAGTPQSIRMDEYAVGIPWYLSNANRGLPIVNESVGGEKTGLLLLPNRHIFMLFKPTLWGFLLMGTEQAVAWNCNFNYMSLLVASF